jgi:hypothetical protein
MIQLQLVQQNIIPNHFKEIYVQLPFARDFFFSIVCNESDYPDLLNKEDFEFSQEDLARIVFALGDEYDQENLENYYFTLDRDYENDNLTLKFAF